MAQLPTQFDAGNRPQEIDPVPRDSDHGRVIAEVGIRQHGPSKDYWKVMQRIVDGASTELRMGYYANSGSGWNWAGNSLMLQPAALNRLMEMATTEGIRTE